MSNNTLIEQTIEHVRQSLVDQESGHDWWHVQRVWQMAQRIAKTEQVAVNMKVVELAALLHDIADYKFHNGDTTVGPRVAREWLEKINAAPETIEAVVDIVAHQSYSSSLNSTHELSLEGKIVQDADRLDSLGAIGIARNMIYAGAKGHPIHDPTEAPRENLTAEAYRSGSSSAIAHWYEKLLLLKDKMNTQTAKAIAEQRHQFMEQYLEQFYKEWDGEV